MHGLLSGNGYCLGAVYIRCTLATHHHWINMFGQFHVPGMTRMRIIQQSTVWKDGGLHQLTFLSILLLFLVLRKLKRWPERR